MSKKIIGHRGYSEIAPENTKLAFDCAYNFGFDGIEIDVHKTKDNNLVVIHDETVDRTSDKTGKVQDLTLSELQKMNFAFQFNAKIPKQTIMTYEEFLSEYGNKFTIINVEIKTDIIHYENIEQLIWEVHTKVKPKAEVIYSSFNFETMKIMRQISKEPILGFLFTESYELEGIIDELKSICQYIHPWFKTLLDARSLEFYQELNLPINTWTVDRNEIGDWWTAGSSSVIEKLKRIDLLNALISNSRI